MPKDDKIIRMSVQQLENILHAQKIKVADKLTGNLSVYHWYNIVAGKEDFDLDKAKKEISKRCYDASFPESFNTLKDFL